MTNRKLSKQDLIDSIDQQYKPMIKFHQVLTHTYKSLFAYIDQENDDSLGIVLHYLSVPDKVIQFRVAWRDDKGCMQVNRGYRIQYCNVLGPYKGGLRFSPASDPDTFHFLAFKQTFKNALTGLPMGGAKGGSDFDPHGKSENEIHHFCKAFMTQLSHYIGPDIDVPAGDIGVGSREIAVMFEHYKLMTGKFTGILTGKDPVFGGSHLRQEATGHGCVYFAEHVLKHAGKKMKGTRCGISGAGNVALYAAEKLIDSGAKVVTVSNSEGVLYIEDGIDTELLSKLICARDSRQSLKSFAQQEQLEFKRGQKPWQFEMDCAFPCATENELNEDDANKLIENGCRFIFEGANMPCTQQAQELFKERNVVFASSNAVNAGGVAVSGLEITQNQTRDPWSSEQVEDRLRSIMSDIHSSCLQYGEHEEGVDYDKGANIAAFKTLATAIQKTALA